MKRSRGRGRRQSNPANRSYDSNGPDVRVRGTANQVFDKYQALARDAQSSGDRVAAENYLQYAEHYYRIMLSNNMIRPDASADDGEGGDDDNQDVGSDRMSDASADENSAEENLEPLILHRNGSAVSDDDSDDDADEDAAPSKPAARSAGRRRGPLRGRPKKEDSPDANDTSLESAVSE